MASKPTIIQQQRDAITAKCREVLNLSDQDRIELHPFGTSSLAELSQHHSYKIVADHRTLALLTLGSDLSELAANYSLVGDALPGVALELYATFKTSEIEGVLSEYFEGISLEAALSTGLISSEEVRTHALSIRDAFESSSEKSSELRLNQEIADSFTKIRQCRIFSAIDRKLLDETIFPSIRPKLERTPLSTYVTNGDFIARNLLYSPSNGVRLIDYEYAKRTHFKWQDAERWKRYSQLKDVDLNYLFESDEALPPEKEIFFLLSQIALDSEKKRISTNQTFLRHLVEGVSQLISKTEPTFKKSVFVNSAAALALIENDSHTTCQLFWDANSRFSEKQSLREIVPLDEIVTKSFVFEVKDTKGLFVRFDPCTTSGLIEFRKVWIKDQNKRLIYEAGQHQGWAGVFAAGHSISLNDDKQLLALSTGPDPYFLFPKIELEDAGSGQKFTAHFEFLINSSIEQATKHLSKLAHLNKDLQKSGLLSEIETANARAADASHKEKLASIEATSCKQLVEHWQRAASLAESNYESSLEKNKALANQLDQLSQSLDQARLALLEKSNELTKTKSELERQSDKLSLTTSELERKSIDLEDRLEQLAKFEKKLQRAETEITTLHSQLSAEQKKSTSLQQLADERALLCKRKEQEAERDANLWSQALKRLDLRLERERSLRNSQVVQYQNQLSSLQNQLEAVIQATGRKGKRALLTAQGETQPSFFRRLFRTHANND